MIIAKATAFMRATANAANTLGEFAVPAHGREMVSTAFSNRLSTFGTRYIKSDLIMALAKPLYLGWSAANRALELWPPTLAAKETAVFAFINGWRHGLTALLTICRPGPNILLVPFAVMLSAETPSKMLFAAYFAESRRSMDKSVFFDPAAKVKVFNPIIVSDFVFVVNLLFAHKYSPKVLLHYQSVFLDVATVIAPRVLRILNHYVAIAIFEFLSRFSIWCSLHTERIMYR